MIPRPVEIRISPTGNSHRLGTLNLVNCPDPRLATLLQDSWLRIIPQTGEAETELIFHPVPKLAASHKDMHLIAIGEDAITLSAKSYQGFLYAIQSLLQLVYIATSTGLSSLACQEISDYPAYSWRGLHLDESRHFFGVFTVKRYLRIMSALKLNKFHWHLTDDQGWRLESKLYPALCQKGAYRTEADGSRYGGYYTQAEIRDIVRYADDLGIEIIPEIDLPGHTMAVLAAYPDLACLPREFAPRNDWGIFEDILCAGNDKAMDFLNSLLAEVAEFFPGHYIHLGGDEAPKTRWKDCPKCQERIRKLSLRDEEGLQAWLFNKLSLALQQKGKHVIGWDEILDEQIDPSLIVMVWRGDGHAAVAKAGLNPNSFILCPNQICYFDWKESADGPGAHGISTLANVYTLDPQSYGRPDLCLGAQANLWTEHIFSPAELEAMLLPRAFALAERVWNPKADYSGFLSRLKLLEGYLDTLS